MPLNVILAINYNLILDIKISRLEKLRQLSRVYSYQVEAPDITAYFVHCYADGAEVCAMLALQALASARETRDGTSRR